jgi:putative FmdB family regulatory protein
MPIYEYRCSDCGFQDEFLQKLSEPQMTVCPSCGKESLKKLLSAAGFQLKGSGWYATDFKSSGTKPAAKADTANPAAAGTSASTESNPSADKPSGDKSSGDKSSGDKPSAAGGAASKPKAPPVAAPN